MPITPHYHGQVCDDFENIGGLATFAITEGEQVFNIELVISVLGSAETLP